MSRMAALLLLALAAPAEADLIEAYLDKTSSQPRCKAAQGDEIMVCGRREADKYRVPFTPAPTPGDPKARGVPEERSRLVKTETFCEQRSAYVYGCGMVGFKVTTKFGGGGVEYRPLAP